MSGIRGKRILIAQGEAGDDSLLGILKLGGFAQTKVIRPQSRTESLGLSEFDLCLVDSSLFKGKAHHAWMNDLVAKEGGTPWAALLDWSEPDACRSALALDPMDFISKPFAMRDVIARMESILTRQEAMIQAAGQPALLTNVPMVNQPGFPGRAEFLDSLSHMINETDQVTCVLIEIAEPNQRLAHVRPDSMDRVMLGIANRVASVVRNQRGIFGFWSCRIMVCAVPSRDGIQWANDISAAAFSPLPIDDLMLPIHGRGGHASIHLRDVEGDAADNPPQWVLHRAYLALQRAEPKCRDLSRFSPSDDTGERRDAEKVLNSILKDRSLIYFEYQPKIDLKTEQLIGCEALIRCRHYETGKPVRPDVFMSLAEETGQMVELGQVVVRQSVQFIQRMQRIRDLGDRKVKVAVNVSGTQFDMPGIGLVGMIKDALHTARIDPAWLEVEVTESTLMSDFKSVKHKLDEMKALGISIALDDFGTGYSSFEYLQDLPIDTLKIDRTFVDGASVDERKGKILRAIVTMAKELGIDTVAEGAEQVSDIDLLRELECSIVQGFYYRPPLSADEFIGLVEENRPVQPRNLPSKQ